MTPWAEDDLLPRLEVEPAGEHEFESVLEGFDGRSFGGEILAKAATAALRSALRQLIVDGDHRREYASRALRRAATYTAQQMASSYVHLYGGLLTGADAILAPSARALSRAASTAT